MKHFLLFYRILLLLILGFIGWQIYGVRSAIGKPVHHAHYGIHSYDSVIDLLDDIRQDASRSSSHVSDLRYHFVR